MRSLAAALAVGVALSFAPVIHAAPADHAPAKLVKEKGKHGMSGSIVSVDGETVTVAITGKDGTAKNHKVKTDSSTKVTLDGKDAKLTDLKAGQKITITPGTEAHGPAAALEATSS